MAGCTACNVCKTPGTLESAVERQRVPSNVREFKDAIFTVWRCTGCGSLHSAEDVDLATYYRDYPLHRLDPNDHSLMTRVCSNNQLGILTRQGIKRSGRILDYGCGAGKFVQFLNGKGYTESSGYDPYVPAHAGRRALDERYDAVVTWDVIEHVEDPREFMRTVAGLLLPGGLLVVGTPNADHISLETASPLGIPELHQPYHRHVLSEEALLQLGREQGLRSSLRLYRSWADSPYPFVNERFVWAYFDKLGGYLDALFDTTIPAPAVWRSPGLLFKAFFGYFLPARRNMILSFRAG